MFNTARGQSFGSSRGNRLGFRATTLTATDRPRRRRLRASVSPATLLWLVVATVTLLGAFVFYHLSRPGKSQIVVNDASTANAKASPKTEAEFARQSRRLRDQALAEGWAGSVRADDVAHEYFDILPLENKHRDNRFLDRRTKHTRISIH